MARFRLVMAVFVVRFLPLARVRRLRLMNHRSRVSFRMRLGTGVLRFLSGAFVRWLVPGGSFARRRRVIFCGLVGPL